MIKHKRKGQVKILIVENRVGESYLIKTMLTGLPTNYIFQEADTLVRGLEFIKDDPPECILLDLNLGDCQGIETFQEVHIAAPLIPVLVLSGMYEVSLAQAAVEAGAIWYILKGSFNREALDLSIQNAILIQTLRNNQGKMEQVRDKALEVIEQQMKDLPNF